MSERKAKPQPDQPQRRSGPDNPGREAARSFADAEARALAGHAMAAEAELTLADLCADDNGEVVFFNDSGFRRLAIRTDARVVADGRAAAHRTAAGADVGGFSFVRFDNGLTLYYEGGLDLVVGAG